MTRRDALMDEMEDNLVTKPTPQGKQEMSYPWDKGAVSTAYQQYTGRTPDDADYETHVGNPGGQQGVLDAIQGSDEAKAYSASQAAAAAPPPAQSASQTTAPLGASGATANRYSGFDTQRAQDPTTSAKDAFLQAANASGSMPSSKEDAEAWFNQYIKQSLIDQGYQVDWVQGDKAFVRTRENPNGEIIDFLIGAGGDNPMLGWQSSVNDPSIGAEGGGGAAAPSTMNSMLSDPKVFDRINATISSLMNSGMSWEDIMAALEGQKAPTDAKPTIPPATGV